MKMTQKIKSGFAGIKSKVSQADRFEAARELGVHPATVNRYIAGEIRKEGFALDLLSFLKKRIEEREKVLA